MRDWPSVASCGLVSGITTILAGGHDFDKSCNPRTRYSLPPKATAFGTGTDSPPERKRRSARDRGLQRGDEVAAGREPLVRFDGTGPFQHGLLGAGDGGEVQRPGGVGLHDLDR